MLRNCTYSNCGADVPSPVPVFTEYETTWSRISEFVRYWSDSKTLNSRKSMGHIIIFVQKISCVIRKKLDNLPSQTGNFVAQQSCLTLSRVWHGLEPNHAVTLQGVDAACVPGDPQSFVRSVLVRRRRLQYGPAKSRLRHQSGKVTFRPLFI